MRKEARNRVEKLDCPGQFFESAFLDNLHEVDPLFFQGVSRGAQHHVLKPPELEEAGVCTVGCREKNVSVEKQAVHLSWPAVWYRIRIDPEFFHFLPRALVVSLCRRRRKEKLGLALGRVSFHRNHNRRSNEDAVFPRFRHHQSPFLDAISFPQLGRNNDGSALTDFYGFHEDPYASISESLNFRDRARHGSSRCDSRERYYFWTGLSKAKSAVGDWQRSLKHLVILAGVPDGHAHRFRDTFSVQLLLAGVPIERVSILLGHQSVRITEKHYAPWVGARQEQLEADVRRTWRTYERQRRVHGGYTEKDARVIPFKSRRKNGGGGGSRTPVRKALRHGAYMLISVRSVSQAALRTSKKRRRLVR